jgi:hypothetical protein
MHDDELMDRLLRDAMASGEEAPKPSAAFDAEVMRRVQPRRLTALGRAVIAVYVVAATVTTAWLMQDLPLTSIVAAAAIGVPVAVGAGVYGQRLAFEH